MMRSKAATELDPDQDFDPLPAILWEREGGLDPRTRRELASALQAESHAAGSRLWIRDESLRHEMVLLGGALRLYLRDPRGRQWNTHLLVGPCFLPPLHLRTREGRASLEVEVVRDSSIQRIDAVEFCRMRGGNETLLRLGSRLVEEEMERLRRREERSLGMDLASRVAALLRERPEIWQVFPNQDIASHLGVTPEALSRALAKARRGR
jgi:CRP-like cAMP-binding protein